MRKPNIILPFFALTLALTLGDLDQVSARNGWSPVVIARGGYRAQLQSMPRQGQTVPSIFMETRFGGPIADPIPFLRFETTTIDLRRGSNSIANKSIDSACQLVNPVRMVFSCGKSGR